jgi:hypothetical protein
VDAQRNAQPNPKGILRAPKYSSKDAAMREPTMKSLDETSESLAEKPRAAAVKDLVVERNPVPQVTSKPDARSIEGYTPKTKNSPMVISSLSDLMGAAGTLPDQHTSTPQVVEADLSFACMTETEYEETVKYAASVDPNELDADLKERGDVIYKDDQGDSFDDEDDDEDSEARSDKDDENEDPLLGLDELEEALPAPEPRAFMTLWTAIKDWITPEAVALIQKWREMNLTYSTLPDWEPQVDRSDVGASRCAGLMSMLKMHLSHSLEELGRSMEEKRHAETRLADFLRTLDYSKPMIKLDSRMWKAMTCVLLEIVLMDSTAAAAGNSRVPTSAKAVGMTPDEYRYLIRSAVISFGASYSDT